MNNFNFKIGFGVDIHQFKEGSEINLGGVKIPHNKGILAHSDGDVLIHALCDAMLGAAGLKDIGHYFPDTASEFKNIDSQILLKRTFELVSKEGFKIGNIDSTICLQKPKIAPYIDSMKQNISELLNIDLSCVSIKATTTEKLGYIGEEKGLKAYAVVLIYK